MKLQSVSLDFNYKTTFDERSPDGYERLLYDAILDKPALFIRADETETSWEFFQPLLDHWAKTEADEFPNYFAGSMGPKAAEEMLKRDGRSWNKAE